MLKRIDDLATTMLRQELISEAEMLAIIGAVVYTHEQMIKNDWGDQHQFPVRFGTLAVEGLTCLNEEHT